MHLKTSQVDYSTAFAQAKLHEYEEIFVKLSQNFEAPIEINYVLKLNKSLYRQPL